MGRQPRSLSAPTCTSCLLSDLQLFDVLNPNYTCVHYTVARQTFKPSIFAFRCGSLACCVDKVGEGGETQHQGLGTQLLARAEKIALQHGYCKVRPRPRMYVGAFCVPSYIYTSSATSQDEVVAVVLGARTRLCTGVFFVTRRVCVQTIPQPPAPTACGWAGTLPGAVFVAWRHVLECTGKSATVGSWPCCGCVSLVRYYVALRLARQQAGHTVSVT